MSGPVGWAINVFNPVRSNDAIWLLINIDPGDGLVPVRHQAITWTNADLLPITPYQSCPMKLHSNF